MLCRFIVNNTPKYIGLAGCRQERNPKTSHTGLHYRDPSDTVALPENELYRSRITVIRLHGYSDEMLVLIQIIRNPRSRYISFACYSCAICRKSQSILPSLASEMQHVSRQRDLFDSSLLDHIKPFHQSFCHHHDFSFTFACLRIGVSRDFQRFAILLHRQRQPGCFLRRQSSPFSSRCFHLNDLTILFCIKLDRFPRQTQCAFFRNKFRFATYQQCQYD